MTREEIKSGMRIMWVGPHHSMEVEIVLRGGKLRYECVQITGNGDGWFIGETGPISHLKLDEWVISTAYKNKKRVRKALGI